MCSAPDRNAEYKLFDRVVIATDTFSVMVFFNNYLDNLIK